MEKIPTEEQVKDFLEQAIFKCELGGPTVQKQLHEWIKTLAGQKSKAATPKLPSEQEAFDIAHGIGQKLFIDMRKAADDPKKNELIAIHAAGATAMYRYLIARLNAPTVCEGE